MKRPGRFKWLALGTGIAAALVAVLAACRSVPSTPAVGSAENGKHLFYDGNFGSPYRTAIPYGLYLAMMERYPELLARDWDDFCSRYGLLPSAQGPGELPVGFVLRPDALGGTPFLMTNCAMCHQGEIAGRRIEGIGNRNLRLNAINNAIMSIARQPDFTADAMVVAARRAAGKSHLPWSWRSDLVARMAVSKLRKLARQYVELDAGPGRNTPIEFAKVACAVPLSEPYGYVKFPATWMYKRRATLGYDGSLQGDPGLTVASVEFNKGMTPAAILAQPQTWQDVYQYLRVVEPPRFPAAIDPALAASGREVFADNCARCHGGGAKGYREKIVPLEEIGTDPDRVNSVTAELVTARNRTPLVQYTRLVQTGGYVCQPLDGIWARAPYLHNASVPSLADLLQEPGRRPKKFAVGSAAGYDLQRVGLAAPVGAGEYFLETSRPGNGNQGHDYGTELDETEKRALLEYLKTL